MTRAHLTYHREDFSPRVLSATEDLFAAKPWRLDLGQLDLYQRWADIVCESYEVPTVGIQKVDYDAIGFGYIEGEAPNIVIGRYSLATLFCAVGAHIANSLGAAPSDNNVRWGFSLFYAVRPVMFRRRVREGRIQGLTARDTFSLDTWNRLTDLGLTDGNFLVDPHFDIRTLDAEDDLVNPDEVAEADEADEDLAQIIPLPSFDGPFANTLRSLPVVTLRRMSRGLFSGGYNMSKEQLVRELIAHGVAEVPSS